MTHPTRRICIICACTAMAVSAYELTSTDSSPAKERSSAAGNQAREQRMIRQVCRIAYRLGMSSPLDAAETTDPATGIDAIQELYNSGYIIPATLEEVEAALNAAAQTPETEDDTAALILKHRGSYRFFIND